MLPSERMLIRDRRKQLGIPLKELAKQLGITRVFLNEIERGDARIPLARIPDLSRILGFTEQDLLRERGDCLICCGTGRAPSENR